MYLIQIKHVENVFLHFMSKTEIGMVDRDPNDKIMNEGYV